MDIKIEEMDESRIDETIELCNLCFEEHTDLEFARRKFKETANDSNHIYLIGSVDGKIVAHLKITVVPTMYGEMATYAILNHVCVHPDYRRHHLGTKLLDNAYSICASKGCKSIELWSKNFRVPAHALYNGYGFVPQDAKYFKKIID